MTLRKQQKIGKEDIIEFSPWQRQALINRDPILACVGASGSGKSRMGIEKLHAFAWRYPGATCLMLRKNRDFLMKSTFLFFQEKILRDYPEIRYVSSRYTIEYPNGSIIILGGMKDERQRSGILSIGLDGGLDFVLADEAVQFDYDDHLTLKTRMRGNAAGWNQICYLTNPGSPESWFYKELVKGEQATVIRSWTIDNPRYAKDPRYIEEQLKTLTGAAYDRYYLNEWKHDEGVVWPEYRRDIHLKTREQVGLHEIPESWPRYMGIDFGRVKTVQWWAHSPDNILYLYRQIYRANISPQDLGDMINVHGAGEDVIFVVGDHDPDAQDALRAKGIPVINAKKNVVVGVEAVRNRLKINPSNNSPQMVILKDSLCHEPDEILIDEKRPTCFEEEIPNYVRVKSASGIFTDMPMKKNDHGCDTARYVILQVDYSQMGAVAIMPSDIYGQDYMRPPRKPRPPIGVSSI